MANITKNLYIQSKDQLYKLIEQHETLSESKLFIPFMDSMTDHYYGCRCDADRFDYVSNNEYIKLNNEEVLKTLKEYFNCNDVIFTK